MDAEKALSEGDSGPAAQSPSTFIASRQSGRRKRRNIAMLIGAAGYLVILGFLVTSGKRSIESKLERIAAKQFVSEEFAGIRPIVSGRNIKLTGSVGTTASAQNAKKLLQGFNLVSDVDVSSLKIGSAAGGVLPFTATYAEGAVTYGGTRPGEQALSELLRASKRGLGDENVKESFSDSSNGGDAAAYARIGEALARFRGLAVRSATVVVTPIGVEISGTLASEESRAEIVQSFAAATGLVVTDSLTAESTVATDGPTTVSPDTTVAGSNSDDSDDSGDSGDSGESTTSTTSTGAGNPATVVSPSTVPDSPSGVAPSSGELASLQQEMVATLSDNRIEFATDSSFLSESAKRIIADLADRLKPFDVQLEIGGHTDSRGNPAKNKALSQRRADAVRNEFVRLGISETKVTAIGFGSTKTVAPDDATRGNPANRRIEITLK